MREPYENEVVSSKGTELTGLKARKQVTTTNFAGRIGGNQEFIDDVNDDSSRQPDAAPISSLGVVLGLRGFRSSELWRMACLEGLGSCLFNFILGTLASGLQTSTLSVPVQAIFASLVNWIGLTLFTYALGPISGAHISPTITMATLFTGLATLPRAVLYISAQVIGALIAGYWLKLGLGPSFFEKDVIPGCTVEERVVTPGQLFALEFAYCLALIFLAFGLGLDPRQGKTISPTYAPVLIGLTLGLGSATSAFARPGYTGMSFNPARCLGLMAAAGDMQYHYIHWLGPLAATILNGIIYRVLPPWAGQMPFWTTLVNMRRYKHRS